MPCPLCDPNAARPHSLCEEHTRKVVGVLQEDELRHDGVQYRLTPAGVEVNASGSLVWSILGRRDVDALPAPVRVWLWAKGMR